MPTQETQIQTLSRLMAYFSANIRLENERGRIDINRIFEKELKVILQVLYGPGVTWLEPQQRNAPGIDYADFHRRNAFQVSSTVNSDKIIRTVNMVNNHYPGQFDTIYLIWLKVNDTKPSIPRRLQNSKYNIHTVDFSDMLRKAEALTSASFTLFYNAFIRLFFFVGAVNTEVTGEHKRACHNFLSIVYPMVTPACRVPGYPGQYYFDWTTHEYDSHRSAINTINIWAKSLVPGNKVFTAGIWNSNDPCYCLNHVINIVQRRVIEILYDLGMLMDSAEISCDDHHCRLRFKNKEAMMQYVDLQYHAREIINKLSAYIDDPVVYGMADFP